MKFFVYMVAFGVGFPIAALAGATSKSESASTKCHTIDSGFLSIYIGDGPRRLKTLDLNNKELTFGSGKALRAVFQACPKTSSPGFLSAGRIVIEPISSNNCLTVTHSSSPAGPFLVKARKCTSDTKPPAAQFWGWGTDDGNVMFWVGSTGCAGGAGVALISSDDLNPQLASRHRVQLTCNSTWESLTLKKTKH